MTNEEKMKHVVVRRITSWIEVLKEVAEEYSGKTIDNIIKQMEARIKETNNN